MIWSRCAGLSRIGASSRNAMNSVRSRSLDLSTSYFRHAPRIMDSSVTSSNSSAGSLRQSIINRTAISTSVGLRPLAVSSCSRWSTVTAASPFFSNDSSTSMTQMWSCSNIRPRYAVVIWIKSNQILDALSPVLPFAATYESMTIARKMLMRTMDTRKTNTQKYKTAMIGLTSDMTLKSKLPSRTSASVWRACPNVENTLVRGPKMSVPVTVNPHRTSANMSRKCMRSVEAPLRVLLRMAMRSWKSKYLKRRAREMRRLKETRLRRDEIIIDAFSTLTSYSLEGSAIWFRKTNMRTLRREKMMAVKRPRLAMSR
mmetsp:Transcript_52755/g.114550  ORF Transcript_52755/g.114550 Transcript_52755/m.114550 type:complete len:314 (-) Transcript_52755:109-1050(-)